MPSTYTTNLGIEKIATGEQSGTWGTTTNTNLDLLDEAVNGIVTVTLAGAGSSGSPNTLAISDGASSDGRNKFIEFNDGGDLGGTAYVQLTPNDAEKIVHIRNSLTASRSIIIFQGTYNASNDFEIPNGADVVLKFDGAGAGAVVSDVFNDLTVTGFTSSSVDINGGAIDGTNIGANSAGTGNFSTLSIGGSAVTATATELNTLDGITATTAELNILDGVTADATELNLLDGVTGTILTDGDLGSTVQAYDADIVAKDVNNTFTAAQRGSTDTDTTNTGSVTLDFDTNQNFVLTLTGNVTLANPTTEAVGQSGFIVFIQDGTGGRTLSLGTDFKTAGGSGITLSSAANAVDVVPYIVSASGSILLGTPQLAFS